MKKIMLFLIFITFALAAQTSNFTYFNKMFEADTMNLLSQVVKPINDGYLVIGGYITVNKKAIYIMKLSLIGDVVWFKHLDEGNNLGVVEDGKFAIATSDNKFVITYAKGQPINGFGEMHLTKFDESGEILWHKVYSDSSSKYAKQVIETTDGGFALVGVQGENSPARYYLLKTDAAGNFEWDRSYILDDSSAAFSIQETPWDGGFIIGGYAYNTASGTGNYDAWVIKTNYLGDTLWTRTYGDPTGNDCACKVIPLTTLQEYFFEGKPIIYLLTGCIKIGSNTYSYAAHLDENGNILWERIYSPENALFNGDVGEGVVGFQTYPIIRADRSYIAVMYKYNSLGNYSNLLVDFDKYGIVNWNKELELNPEADCYLKDMQPTPDGGYVLAGYRYDVPQKGWILKIDADGNYCTPVGCDSTVVVSAAETAGLPNKTPMSLVQINPNPVRGGGVFTISHQLPAEFPVAQFILYNQLGKAVWQQEFNTWDRTKILQLPPGLPMGLYLWQVSYMGNVAASGKVVVE
ncbi:hypothetical protein C7N43_02790 [Sphingobacteriales bacterium UPWRP_1]|nr:hypothetical protein BVG80_09300 [Sphingobacteriales bacterium TSM_CSM]PSJ78548.1 hypothetical protein C7N43_02790 [Sphingobacteriales bacterium UPWRP_1]